MEVTKLRNKLHNYIDVADIQHLQAIYVLVGGEATTNKSLYDDATMNMLYQRRENHRNGKSKSYPIEEGMNIIRRQNNDV